MQKKGKDGDDSTEKLKKFSLEPTNKRCFDCAQRGPTYINVTIGAFVCSSCGGLLRGMPTPQRIKSISMAKFSPTEVESVLQRGNEVCRSIWLGKWEKSDPPTFDRSTDTGKKDFLLDKYEKKLWYVEPSMATVTKDQQPETKSLKQIAEKRNSPIAVPRARGSSSATPPLSKSLSLSSPPTNMRTRQQQHPAMTKQHSLQSVPGRVQVTPPQQPRQPIPEQQPVTQQQQQQQPVQQQQQQPVPPQPNPVAPISQQHRPSVDDIFSAPPTGDGISMGFANFDTPPPFVSTASFLQPQNSIMEGNDNNSWADQPAPAVKTVNKELGGSDRYAALADLDNTLRSLTFTSNSGFSCTSQSIFEKEPAETPPRPQPTAARPPQQQMGSGTQFHSNNPFTAQGGGWVDSAPSDMYTAAGGNPAIGSNQGEQYYQWQQQQLLLHQQQQLLLQQQQQMQWAGQQQFQQPAQANSQSFNNYNPFMQPAPAPPQQFQSNPFK